MEIIDLSDLSDGTDCVSIDTSGKVFVGYSYPFERPSELTPAQRVELAQIMVNRWLKYAGHSHPLVITKG